MTTFTIPEDVQASVSTAFEGELTRGFVHGVALSIAMDVRRSGS